MTAVRPTADAVPTIGPDGPICRITELATVWCGHCRYPQAGHRRMRDRMSRRAAPRAVEITTRFPARYSGPCALCDRTYAAGELIAGTVDGDYVCQECAW